jgi:LysM repeat protein
MLNTLSMRNDTPSRSLSLSKAKAARSDGNRFGFDKLSRRYRFTFLLAVLLCVVGCQSAEPNQPTSTPPNTPTIAIGVDFVTRAPATVAVIQVTPTPLPSPTPLPTATPIVYAIQQGDTLWDVAYLNYTTIEEIIANNPDVRPENLQIGQQIVLPPPATPVFQSGLATPVPIAVDVTQLRTYRTPVGNLWVMGEVLNRGEVSAENVRVEIALLDNTGQPATNVQAWVVPGIIPAGRLAPFGVLVEGIPDQLSDNATIDTIASVIGGNSVVDLGSRYLDLAVDGLVLDSAENRVTINGNVTNTGDTPTAPITLVITLYDASGNVSGTVQLFDTQPLAAGDSRPFSATVAPPGGAVTTAKAVVQGLQHTPP